MVEEPTRHAALGPGIEKFLNEFGLALRDVLKAGGQKFVGSPGTELEFAL